MDLNADDSDLIVTMRNNIRAIGEHAIALEKEIERIRFDLDSTKKGGAVIGDLLNKERGKTKALEKDNRALREALEKIANPKQSTCLQSLIEVAEGMRATAIAALSSKEVAS